jgi:hypothetical protein
MKLRISLPTVPTRSPSPEQTTLPASATAVTATLRGQPFTCLQIEYTILNIFCYSAASTNGIKRLLKTQEVVVDKKN